MQNDRLMRRPHLEYDAIADSETLECNWWQIVVAGRAMLGML
jgi:hypothetical protein